MCSSLKDKVFNANLNYYLEINKVPIEPKNNDFSFSSSGILYSIDEGDRYVSSKFKKCESESVSDF